MHIIKKQSAKDSLENAKRFLRMLNEQINSLAQNLKFGRGRDDLAIGLRSIPFDCELIDNMYGVRLRVIFF